MAKKIGRNEPCWCGSGKKYKKCHLDRDKREKIKPHDANKNFMNKFNRKICMHPDAPKGCSKKIINSHTISKCHLSTISRNGKIYFYNRTNIFEMEKNKGIIKPTLVGTSQASVFFGFCSTHDKELFSPIENQQFQPIIEHAIIAGFRAFCIQLYGKENTVNLFDELELDRGRTKREQLAMQEIIQAHKIAAQQDVDQLQEDKTLFHSAITSQKTDDFSYFCIEFKQAPKLMVTGYFTIGTDFNGKKIHKTSAPVMVKDIAQEKLKAIKSGPRIPMTAAMYLSSQDRHYSVFCWPKKDSPTFNPIMESLYKIPKNQITDALIYTALVHCENVVLSPDWWETLSVDKQDKLNSLAQPTVNSENTPFSITDLLSENKPIFDDWEPIAFYSDAIETNN
ncbi:SEC-C domain-containing protein [Maridesulfovibrio sp.]|uniref:YecA family protein n=1 Tax=Maridesulfovibrio sp. TaxID=2795000 RepID=UPI0029CA9A59|nr:SEC-C domain-containing protein [Maridesulfovibrio sp.]